MCGMKIKKKDTDGWVLQFISTSTVTPQLKYGPHAMSSGLEIHNLTPDGVAVFFVWYPG
jgi:hypothetical protein